MPLSQDLRHPLFTIHVARLCATFHACNCTAQQQPPWPHTVPVYMHAELPSNRVQPPAEGRWRGLPSGLKSALQKVVRLGRPGPAARIALQVGVGWGGVGWSVIEGEGPGQLAGLLRLSKFLEASGIPGKLPSS